MKKIMLFIVAVIFAVSCTDDLEVVPADNSQIKINSVSQLDGPIVLLPYVWSKRAVPVMNGYPFNNPSGTNSIYQVNGETFCAVGGIEEFWYKLNKTTLQWELFNDPFNVYVELWVHQYFFSYGSNLYYGMLLGNPNDEDNVHAIDPLTGAKTSVPDFPGTPSTDVMSFTIGSKGYIIGGARGNRAYNQFWEYDFITKQWTNKGTLPGGSRAGGVALVIGNSVYLGLGYTYLLLPGNPIRVERNDWIKITPSTGTSTTLTTFPGGSRSYPKGFVINDKVYLGWGQSQSTGSFNDFWEYSPSTNGWTAKGNGPTAAGGWQNINVFSINTTGYLVKGNLSEFWQYKRAVITLP